MNPITGQSATGRRAGRLAAVLAAACVAFAALPGPAVAMQVLEAADHAELEAAVSATGVSRVALAHDRIRRVIRSPGGFDVEHDAASGDLYVRPAEGPHPSLDEPPVAPLPVTLFLGTERGFTYRLTLTPDARPSAQVLIRNAAAAADPAAQATAGPARGARVADLVRLVRAAARREILPDYIVESGPAGSGRRAIETWRGARFTVHVLAAGPDTEAAALARRFGAGVAAVWVTSPPGSTDRERVAVVVTEPARAGTAR
ncbi:MAG: type-F conjugative transfer system secretin TraK [Acidobacteria bacterium]|nr:type-F conjugative transfer system secretin TraK [Acidobacteriota bacterium]